MVWLSLTIWPGKSSEKSKKRKLKKNSQFLREFLCLLIMSVKTKLPRFVDLRRKGECQQNPFWDLKKLCFWFLTMSNIYFNFILFFISKLNIIFLAWYRPKSAKFLKWASIGGEFHIPKWGWLQIKIQLCPLWKRVLRI